MSIPFMYICTSAKYVYNYRHKLSRDFGLLQNRSWAHLLTKYFLTLCLLSNDKLRKCKLSYIHPLTNDVPSKVEVLSLTRLDWQSNRHLLGHRTFGWLSPGGLDGLLIFLSDMNNVRKMPNTYAYSKKMYNINILMRDKPSPTKAKMRKI